MRLLRREEILASTLQVDTLPAPEWGDDCWVRVRAMSGLEREAMDRHVYDNRNAGKPYSLLGAIAAYSIIDEDGRRMFAPEEILQLAELNQAPLERIWDWQTKHSGLGARALEDAQKNSATGQNGATSSVSSGASAG